MDLRNSAYGSAHPERNIASDATNPRLAIIMPTVRFDAIARQAITTLAAIASEDICVHIGDNSGNPEKHAFLRKLASSRENVRVSCHATDIGAEANWLHLVREQTAPFICMVADDDSFCGAYFTAALELIANDKACGAACGLLVSVADDCADVPVLYSPPERTEAAALDRIGKYTNQNAIAYALTRTELIRSFAEYVELNPLKCGFNDYILAFHILSTSTFRVDRRGHIYAYNNDNWHDFAAAMKARGKFYVGCGLPEAFGLLERVHWAVANAHFFSSRYRAAALAPHDASQIAVFLFNRMMSDFREERKAARPALDSLLGGHADAERALARLADADHERVADVFELFANLIAPFSPGLARQYHAFLLDSLSETAKRTPFVPAVKKRRFWGLV